MTDSTTLVVGVDQGLAQALVAEHPVAHARARLQEAGLGAGLWLCTHVVSGGPSNSEGGNHVAYALEVDDPEQRPAQELAELVRGCFAPEHEPAVVLDDVLVGDESLADGARQAVGLQREGLTGRAVVYPGSERLVGRIPLADVTRLSAIDEVAAMGGQPGDDAELETRDHVRPLRQDGRWVLHVQPARGGVQVPFENPVHQSCCADHW